MLLENKLYSRQIDVALKGIGDSTGKLAGCSVLITGASGMLGSCVTDMLLYMNERYGMNMQVYLAGRNTARIEKRFDGCRGKSYLHILSWDATGEQGLNLSADYIIHAASNADPVMFADCPVDTFLANITGVKNLLDLALKERAKRMLYISSGEMYGQPDGTADAGFSEDYSGYLDYKDPRSCYPPGKRAGEMLCQGYIRQHEVDVVIVRPCHCYGPTMTDRDSRALSQFFRKARNKEDILLKSSGKTVRSHCYVVDAAAGILRVLLEGKCGEAYNIADPDSVASIREAAELIAGEAGRKVCFEIPDETERQGYSKVSRSVLDSRKIFALGWRPQTDLRMGVCETLKIMQDI